MVSAQDSDKSEAASFRLGLWLAVVGAIAFSGKAIFVKLIYRHDIDPVTLIMLRMLLSLPFFMGMAWWASRQTHAREHPLTRADIWPVVGLGFMGYFLASYLDFLGLQYISAGLERLILYLNPTLVLLLGWVLYRKTVGWQRLAAMSVSYAGILLVFGHEAQLEGPLVAQGAALVFASALVYALYLIISGQLVKRIGSMRLVGLASSVACLFSLAQFMLVQPMALADVPLPVWWLSLANAVLCTVTPVLLVMMAIERVGAGLASQAGMVGPMSTILMGVVFLGEPFNAWILGGTVLVLIGVYMVSRTGGQ